MRLAAGLCVLLAAAAYADTKASGPFSTGNPPTGGCIDPYAWYPALCLDTVPFQAGAGAWGAQEDVYEAVAPTTTRTVHVTTAAQLQTEASTNGTHIIVDASYEGDSCINGDDIDIEIPPGVVIEGTFQLDCFPFDDVQRIRIRGTTPGTHSGGLLGQVNHPASGSDVNTSDIIIDGIDLNGDVTTGSGIAAPVININNTHSLVVVNARINSGGSCFLSSALHLVIAGTSCFHGARRRADMPQIEGWGFRGSGTQYVVYDVDVRGTRYGGIRFAPDVPSVGYAWISNTTYVEDGEGQAGWCWADLGGPDNALACWIVNSTLYLDANPQSDGCGFTDATHTGHDVDNWVHFTNNIYHGDYTSADATTNESTHTATDTDFATANSYNDPWVAAYPAWGGAGDAQAVPLPDGLSPSYETTCHPGHGW